MKKKNVNYHSLKISINKHKLQAKLAAQSVEKQSQKQSTLKGLAASYSTGIHNCYF